MWSRKRKVYEYYISRRIWCGQEKNLDFRAGPDMIDVYKRVEEKCSKEKYEKYPHEMKNSDSIYTYRVDMGYEPVSPKESYEMVKPLLNMPINKISTSYKGDIKWAIQAIDILIERKEREIFDLEMQDDIYTLNYIKTTASAMSEEIDKMKEDKKQLEKILDNLSNRKANREEEKRKEEEIISNTLVGVLINCDCGATIHHSYNKKFCGMCGKDVTKLWQKTAKKIMKRNKKENKNVS